MNKLQTMTLRLAQASKGEPVTTTIVVLLFYLAFNGLEACAETVLFGHPFPNIMGLIAQIAFIAYAAYAVYWCAVFNTANKER